MRVRLAGTARVLARSAGAVTELRAQPVGRFGHIALPEPVLHPLAREPLARIVDLAEAEVTALALGHKLLVHEGARTEFVDAAAFDRLARERPALRALDTADALLRLLEERGAARAAQLQLGKLGIQHLFLLAVPVLPSALRQLDAPYRSLDTFHDRILFHVDRHARTANLPAESKRESRAAIAQAVFDLFDNERRTDPLRGADEQPERSLRGHLETLAGGALAFEFERGEQVLALEPTPDTRALLEGLALEIVPDPRYSLN